MPGHESYYGMLAIPYYTVSGVEAMKFRVIDGRPGPRYLNSTGQLQRIYNVEAVLSGLPYIAVCEGELDTVVAHHVCGLNAVGISGANNWKSHFGRVFRGFPNVFILVDNDDKEDGSNPGQELAARILRDLPWARNISLPRGSDVNDYVMANGTDALAHLVGIDAGQ